MRGISILLATLLYCSAAVAYSSPDGDPFYIDNYAMSEEYSVAILGDVKEPEPIPEPEEDKNQQTMSYNDWIASGYYY